MTDVVICLPALNPEWALACLDSMMEDVRCHAVIVDNTRDGLPDDLDVAVYREDGNMGVAASWNVGLDVAEVRGADWLVVLSEAVQFGMTGGEDLLDALRRCDRLNCEVTQPYPIVHANDFAWHLQAISRATWQAVGRFDPIFWPAYFEDTDYLYRMGVAGLPSPRENGGQFFHVTLDATDRGNGHCIQQRLVDLSLVAQEAKYVEKWGGRQGAESFTHPYDDPSLDWTHTGGLNAG